jgi:hypothetical protein
MIDALEAPPGEPDGQFASCRPQSDFRSLTMGSKTRTVKNEKPTLFLNRMAIKEIHQWSCFLLILMFDKYKTIHNSVAQHI